MKHNVGILRQIKRLLSDRDKWLKNSQAKNDKGRVVEPNSPDACSWCLVGALRKVCGSDFHTYNVVYLALAQRTDKALLTSFNDSTDTTYNDIINFINHTINDWLN